MNLDPQKLLREGKLIAALMSSELDLLDEVQQQLAQIFGACELRGALYSFDAFSAYYEREMGTGLQKRFISFAGMIQVETLPGIKHKTNTIEAQYASNEQRRINIDPGYVTHAQMVLATTKPYSHRIYLGNGIHAELTYLCKGKNFYPMDWTYPDYREPFAIRFFEQVRALYLQEMRARNQP